MSSPPDYSDITSLMIAAASGRKDMVRAIIRTHTEAHSVRDAAGRTALMIACLNGHVGVVDIITRHNPAEAAETCDNKGATAAGIAAQNGQYGCIRAIGLVIPSALGVLDDSGQNLAMRAVRAGHNNTGLALLADGSACVMHRDADRRTMLMAAVVAGDTRLVRTLITDYGADARARDVRGQTAFMLCVHKNNTTHIIAMLALGVMCAGTHDHNGHTSVMIAASNGNCTAIRCILARSERYHDGGESVHDVDSNGWTPLVFAAHEGHSLMARTLVHEYGADVNVLTSSKWTAIFVAASQGHTQTVKTLALQCGADVHRKLHNQWSILSLATDCGHTETATALVCECGVDVDAREGTGWRAIMYATTKAHTATIVALGSVCNADVNGQNDLGVTALMMASELGSLQHVRFLCMECGAEPDTLAMGTTSALMMAAANGHTAVVVALVVECGANVDLKNKHGWTALHMAARGKHPHTVRALVITCKADTSAVCSNYGGFSGIQYSAAAFSAESGDLESLCVLMASRDFDVHHTTAGGQTILLKAAALGKTAAVDCLISEGADVDHRDEEHNTALMMSCLNGHAQTAYALVHKHAASVHLQNKSGNTAFGLACMERQYNIMAFLATEFGADPNAMLNTNGSTPLAHTIAYGSLKGTMLLLGVCGVDVSTAEPDQTNALMIAAIHSRVAILPVLVNEHALDVNAQNSHGFTALTFAVIYGTDETVAALLALRARGDIHDTSGNYAYHFAAMQLRRPVVRMLIDEHMRMPLAIADAFVMCLCERGEAKHCLVACLHAELIVMVLRLYTHNVVNTSPFASTGSRSTRVSLREINFLTTHEHPRISENIADDVNMLFSTYAHG